VANAAAARRAEARARSTVKKIALIVTLLLLIARRSTSSRVGKLSVKKNSSVNSPVMFASPSSAPVPVPLNAT